MRDTTLAFQVPLIVVGTKASEPRLREALRAGARDAVIRDAELATTLPRAIKAAMSLSGRRPARAVPAPRLMQGRLVGFLAVHEGAGSTTALLNFAAALERERRPVIAAELDLWTSSFAAQLHHTPIATLADLLDTPEHVSAVIERYLTPLSPRVRLLMGPLAPRAPQPGDAERLHLISRFLARLADYVLVDLPAGLPEASLRVVAHLDHIVLVTPPCAGAQADAADLVARLVSLGMHRARMSLLTVERDQEMRDVVPVDTMAGALGINPLGALPPAASLCRDAAERGLPALLVAPGHALSAACTRAVSALGAAVEHERLRVAIINADDAVAERLAAQLHESTATRFELVRAACVDDILAEVSRGAFHAVLLIPRGSGEEFECDLKRLTAASPRTAVTVVTRSADEAAMHTSILAGAQDCLYNARIDPYWLSHCLVTAIERQRTTYDLHARMVELESCEATYRRLLMQVLRTSSADPRMV